MHKDPRFPIANRAGDMLCGQGRRQGEIAPVSALPRPMMSGLIPAQSQAKSWPVRPKGGYLVGNQQQAELSHRARTHCR